MRELEIADAYKRALVRWSEKLDFLLGEEVTLVDPADKFRIRQLVREAERRIQDLENIIQSRSVR